MALPLLILWFPTASPAVTSLRSSANARGTMPPDSNMVPPLALPSATAAAPLNGGDVQVPGATPSVHVAAGGAAAAGQHLDASRGGRSIGGVVATVRQVDQVDVAAAVSGPSGVGAAANATTCVADSDCDGDGYCSDGQCVCSDFFSGPTCEVPFTAGLEVAWEVFYVGDITLFGCLWLVQAFFILRLFGWCGGTAAELSTRDGCMLLNQLAVTCRVVWCIDPKGLQHVLAPQFEAVILRLPQVLWIGTLTLVVIMWESIVALAQQRQVASGLYRRAYCVFAVLSITTIPMAVIASWPGEIVQNGVGNYLDIAQNGIFAGSALMLTVVGAVYARRLFVVLHTFGVGSEAYHVVRKVRNTVTGCVVLGTVTCGTVALKAGLQITPRSHPQLYICYLFAIHWITEAGVATLLFYASMGARRLRDSSMRTNSRASKQGRLRSSSKKRRRSRRSKEPIDGGGLSRSLLRNTSEAELVSDNYDTSVN